MSFLRGLSTHWRAAAAIVVLVSCPTAARPQGTVVFSTDFESGLPAQFSAPGSQIEGVQGWAGLGPAGYQFSGSFLRYSAQTLYDTQLSLSDLPPHESLDLRFLLAVIDSWDGTELLQVLVDGNLVFSHWFQLALGDTTSYVPAPGARLSAGTNLGFTSGSYFNHDRAYNMAVEPAFLEIPHTASTANIVWRISAVSGPAAAQWQGGGDESWAIERVEVAVNAPAVAVGGESRAAFGLMGAFPNPSPRGQLNARFTLGDEAAPPAIEVFDVAGRRVARRDVGALGPGVHEIDLRGERAMPSGVYLMRLTQGANAEVRRLVVLR